MSEVEGKGQADGVWKAVLVAALGYFVDVYDLILFSIVRVKSLTDIGVGKEQMLDTGVMLLNLQMIGMLVGGVLWGVLGDKRGRLAVLYGSILMYSLANIANGFVQSVEAYGVLRFLAGVGLAGELGAGVTLVMELMDRQSRGWGTTIIATVGLAGGVAASLVGDLMEWRWAYFIGGGLGLLLLLLRIRVGESSMFQKIKASSVARGSFWMLFWPWKRAWRYIRVVALGLPTWFTAGILITFCPEFGRAFGMVEAPTAGKAVLFFYVGLTVGDLASGVASQLLRSRKKVVGASLVAAMVAVGMYFGVGPRSLEAFYGVCLLLGLAHGYWAIFVTMASEQFGTNLRSTATTSVPNFARGAAVPITLSFQALKGDFGVTNAALIVGSVCIGLALLALVWMEESFGKDMDFLEE